MRLPWRRGGEGSGEGRRRRLPEWKALSRDERRQYRWWGVLFFAVGVLATAAVGITLFSGLGDTPPRLTVTARPPVTSEAFMDAMAGSVASPVRSGGSARLLNDGVQIFPALLADLRGARHTIDFMVYIWEPGQVSDTVFDVLVERARAGVRVRVLLDGMGGGGAPEERIRELRAAGGKVARFRPLRLGMLTRYHKRNHRRAIVVDGVVGYTGGAAVADKWLGDADTPEEWREMMVRVTGPLALSLQGAFAQLWSGTTGELLAGEAFFPDSVPVPAGGDPIARHVNVVSSPGSENHPLRKVFWLSFAAARQRLYVANAYFVPDEHLREVLKERARAGVDVRVLVPGPETDAAPVRWAGQSHYQELLEAGVRIYEYRPTMMHAKTLVVDGAWSVVGSANMDVRSKELNQENVLGMLDRSFAAELERTFLADLGRSREIRLAEWKKRGAWAKTREEVSALFAEQF